MKILKYTGVPYLICLLLPYIGFGQSSSENYISTHTVLKEGYTNPTTVHSHANTDNVVQEIMYYDALGRPMQQVKRDASPGGNDIIQPFDYNEVGLETEHYLPYTGYTAGSYDGSWYNNQANFYLSTNDVSADDEPFGITEYDHSPLKRVLRSYNPGSDWHAQGRSIDYTYTANSANEVIKWEANGYGINTDVVSNGYYDAQTLQKMIMSDEDGNLTMEYSNFRGNTLLKKVYDGTKWLETYYVYNDLDMLCVVIPPKALESLQFTGELGTDPSIITVDTELSTLTENSYVVASNARLSLIDPLVADASSYGSTGLSITSVSEEYSLSPIDELCYTYIYDHYGNISYKSFPGSQTIRYNYRPNGNLVYWSDASMCNNVSDTYDDEYIVYTYDELNRLVLISKLTPGVESNMVSVVCPTTAYFDETATNSAFYNWSRFVLNNRVNNDNIITANYYDRYFTDDISTNLHLQDINVELYFPASFNDFNTSYSNHTHGLLTRTKVKNLENGEFYNTLYYYDDKARTIKTVAENQLGGFTVTKFKYDFVGNLLATVEKQTVEGEECVQGFRYTYDKMGRLLNTYHSNGNSISDPHENLIAQNEYNELGQLIKKSFYGTGPSALQEINYSYNIRGWLESINNPDAIDDDLFAMRLHYQDVGQVGILNGNRPRYNGNISGIEWKDYTNTNTVGKAYGFTYDGINRLTSANHSAGGTGHTPTNSYSVANIGYDVNGNITKLKRYGAASDVYSPIDDLTYSYINGGNQLRAVSDAGNLNAGFKDGNNGSDYSYDIKGNMTKDLNNGIEEITYNHLNLPSTIKMSGEQTMDYHYDAAGNKLTNIYTSNSGIKITDYINNFVYVDGELEYILHPEGRLLISLPGTIKTGTEPDGGDMYNTETVYTYEYHLKDHLGNTRVAFTDNGGTPQVTQINDYYPFGMRHEPVALDDATQKYLYNGKELQEGTGWYDYEFRFYDPAVGRFHTLDPLAESFSFQSPYAYAGNDPVGAIDCMGLQKLKISGSFGITTGKVGAKAKIADVGVGGSYSRGGGTQKVEAYVEVDVSTGKFNFGISHSDKLVDSESSYNLGPWHSSTSNDRETKRDLNTQNGAEKTEDKTFTETERNGFGPVTTEETSNGSTTNSVSAESGVEVNAMVVGVEASVSVEYSDGNNTVSTQQQSTTQSDYDKKLDSYDVDAISGAN